MCALVQIAGVFVLGVVGVVIVGLDGLGDFVLSLALGVVVHEAGVDGVNDAATAGVSANRCATLPVFTRPSLLG